MEPLLDVRPPPPPLSVARTVGERSAPDVAALVQDLQQLPAQRPALLRVVQLADDPDCSVRGLADVAALDPAYAARLLQLANSAYYGRSGRVSAIGPAVAMLGAETLRGLAVAMALRLSGEHGSLPDGFWDRAATTAAASRLLAPRVAADPGDAFCVGLLREVGQALLFRAAPASYAAQCEDAESAALAAAERAWCGITHGELGAQALAAAGLPETLCRTIADHQHHDELGTTPATPLGRALRGGIVLARAVATGEVETETTDALHAITSGALPPSAVRALALRTAAQAAALSSAMR